MLIDPIEIYKKMNLYAKDNGMKLIVETPGSSQYTMTILEKHLSSPNTCHGGVIAGFMDGIIGAAALSLAFKDSNLVSTIEFKINYFKPVHLGDELEGFGKTDFTGKSIITSSGEIFNKSKNNELVAKAMGTFNIYPLSKKDFKGDYGL